MRKNRFLIPANKLMDGIPLIDFHIHTKYSDGRSTIKEYVDAAAVRGFCSISFTDHVDFTTKWFNTYSGEVDRCQTACDGLKIFRGIEVRARDHEGNLNAPEELLGKAEFVIGVVHSIPSKNGNEKHSPAEFTKEKLLELERAISLKLLENDLVTVLGHPMSNYEKLYGPVPGEVYRELIEKALTTGKAIEINAKYKNDFQGFLRLCLEMNPLVSLGSDAHSVSELGAVNQKINGSMIRCQQ